MTMEDTLMESTKIDEPTIQVSVPERTLEPMKGYAHCVIHDDASMTDEDMLRA
jgi:hypothetical protein